MRSAIRSSVTRSAKDLLRHFAMLPHTDRKQSRSIQIQGRPRVMRLCLAQNICRYRLLLPNEMKTRARVAKTSSRSASGVDCLWRIRQQQSNNDGAQGADRTYGSNSSRGGAGSKCRSQGRRRCRNKAIAAMLKCCARMKTWPTQYGTFDIAIGAPGVSQFERACCGLPSILVAQSERQEHLVRAWGETGAVLSCGSDEKAISTASRRISE